MTTCLKTDNKSHRISCHVMKVFVVKKSYIDPRFKFPNLVFVAKHQDVANFKIFLGRRNMRQVSGHNKPCTPPLFELPCRYNIIVNVSTSVGVEGQEECNFSGDPVPPISRGVRADIRGLQKLKCELDSCILYSCNI